MPKCDICGIDVSRQNNMKKHQESEGCKRINLEKLLQEKEEMIQTKEGIIQAKIQEKEEMIKAQSREIYDLKTRNENYSHQLSELALKCKLMQEHSNDFKSIVEKVALKPTTTVNQNNKTTNNILQILSPDPLSFQTIRDGANQFLSMDLILKGDNAMAGAIVKTFFTDENGKHKIICTDLARETFKYTDEKTGQMTVDPKLNRVMKELRDNSREKYSNGIHMALYDAAHTEIDKEGKSELDVNYLTKLTNRGKFQSKKVIKIIADTTYIKAFSKIQFNE